MRVWFQPIICIYVTMNTIRGYELYRHSGFPTWITFGTWSQFTPNVYMLQKPQQGLGTLLTLRIHNLDSVNMQRVFALRANCGYLRHLFTGVYHFIHFRTSKTGLGGGTEPSAWYVLQKTLVGLLARARSSDRFSPSKGSCVYDTPFLLSLCLAKIS